jgi:phosphoribosylanthranilate isomerase
MRTRVKICGITRLQDAAEATQAGADAIGLVFYASSPRNVELELARSIAASLPAFVTVVGLFVDPDPAFVAEARARVPLDLLQFHGDEEPAFCERFAAPYIKAVRVREDLSLLEYARRFGGARGLLLDSYVSGMRGGTGQRFDWSLIPTGLPLPIVLSGGLDPANVSDAIRRVRPWAVDVSSGVEATKGIKDPARILAFMTGVRNADA